MTTSAEPNNAGPDRVPTNANDPPAAMKLIPNDVWFILQ